MTRAEGPVGVDLHHEIGVVGTHGAHRRQLPAGLDLQPHPGRAVAHHVVDLAAQRAQVVVVRNAHHGTDRHGLEAVADPEVVGQGAPGVAQLGVGHRHLEGGGEHPVDGRGPEQLRHL